MLQGADGVAFVADSQIRETENNAAAFVDLRDNLRELGLLVADMPLVIQFNKRDLPGVRTDAEIEQPIDIALTALFDLTLEIGNLQNGGLHARP